MDKHRLNVITMVNKTSKVKMTITYKRIFRFPSHTHTHTHTHTHKKNTQFARKHTCICTYVYNVVKKETIFIEKFNCGKI